MKISKVKVLFYVIILFLVIDFLSGILILELFNNSKSGIVLKEKTIFFETDSEMLIFGSSRAAFHYVPEVFEEKLSLSTYNAGREGTGVFFHYAVLIATIERYSPKSIILDLDFRDVYDRGGDFGADVFKQLSPYYGLVNNEFDEYITRNYYDRIFYQSNLIKYNKKILNILTSNISSTDNTIQGFEPLVGNKKVNKDAIDNNFKYDVELVNTIEKFIKKTKEHNIDLILVISPTQKNIPNEFINIVDSIGKNNNIRVINFIDKDVFKNELYFYDLEHLNREGALKFSEMLSKEL